MCSCGVRGISSSGGRDGGGGGEGGATGLEGRVPLGCAPWCGPLGAAPDGGRLPGVSSSDESHTGVEAPCSVSTSELEVRSCKIVANRSRAKIIRSSTAGEDGED